MLVSLGVFFFKQKTAYEMRISDWSSDVCSSDLSDIAALGLRVGGDILHLVEEEFARVERETFLGLVAIVGIILGVGDDRDREFSVLGLRRRLRRAEHGKQHEHNMFDRHYIRLPKTPSEPHGGTPDDSENLIK